MSEKYPSPQPGYQQQPVPPSYQNAPQPGYQSPQPAHQQHAHQQPAQPVYHQQPVQHQQHVQHQQPVQHQQTPVQSPGAHQPPQGVLTHQGPPQTLGNEWGSGFWDCFDPIDACLCGWCVPCMLFGKTQARMKDPSLANFSYCNGNCCGWFCLACCGCSWIFQALKRGDMRDQFGIEGSVPMDFLGACCCPCCGLVQQEKEAVRRHQAGQGQGYQKTEGMSYA
ncbi:hypothetical protein FQN54_000130 [Arachnomyces sp. PD_36]|nr:hypothetical protein FQN54_000130 [Arachnomyces sp. PD_36]